MAAFWDWVSSSRIIIWAHEGPAKFGNEDDCILSNAANGDSPPPWPSCGTVRPAPPFMSVSVLDVLAIDIHIPPRMVALV